MRPSLLIDPSELINIQKDGDQDIILVDLGKAERFFEEHIPGAQLVLPSEIQAGAPIPGLIPSPEALSELVSRLGLTDSKHVIVYDDEGGGWAGRFIWLLDEIGHSAYSYLDGGLLAWKLSGAPTESGNQSPPPPIDLSVAPTGGSTINADRLIQSLDQLEFCIWDARSPEEFSGEKMLAKRGGHIPGAVNYEWTKAMDLEHGKKLRPLEAIRQELLDLGIDGSKPIVTHCQTHHRSGLTYLIAKLLGYEVKAYSGSWGEWGNRDDTPITS